MKFRARLLLAILLPASILVAAAVGAALMWNQRTARDAVDEGFRRAQKAVVGVISDQRKELLQDKESYDSAWFRDFINSGSEVSARPDLSKELDLHFPDVGLKPDYFAAASQDGTVWIQRYAGERHVCEADSAEPCNHSAPVRWASSPPEALFRGVNGLCLGWRMALPGGKGGLIIGKNIEGELGGIAENLNVKIRLLWEGAEVYRSFGTPAPAAAEGDARLDGERHVTGRLPLMNSGELTLYRSMKREDDERSVTLLFGSGALALAVLLAALVSARVSRGISRPVELLVGATRQVGAGDYSAQVSIPGQDEMATLGSAFNDMTEGLRKRREIMEKTLTRDVAEELMKGVELGGERRRVTVLFTDVRGFTSGTEGVDPAEVVTMLNDMMNFLAEAISKQGGNVNKFLGDGIMAMFGAPKELPDQAWRAVQAALEMQREMAAWNGRRSGRGLPPFNIGIGINTGLVLGGKVGSRNRLEYTLIGEEVNLSSRVCGKAAPGQVLITKATLAELGGRVRVRELEPVHVKGLSYPVPIFEVQA